VLIVWRGMKHTRRDGALMHILIKHSRAEMEMRLCLWSCFISACWLIAKCFKRPKKNTKKERKQLRVWSIENLRHYILDDFLSAVKFTVKDCFESSGVEGGGTDKRIWKVLWLFVLYWKGFDGDHGMVSRTADLR
jgi:hypothetical protein